VSLGLSQLFDDDAEQLRHGFVVCDALYAWLTRARGETHSWNPQRIVRESRRSPEILGSQCRSRTSGRNAAGSAAGVVTVMTGSGLKCVSTEVYRSR
jgi:hypothetical protein